MYVGPATASYQVGNNAFLDKYVDRLLANPAVPAAESFMLAQRDVLVEYAGNSRICETVKAYAFLGDPVSRVMNSRHRPTSVEDHQVHKAGITSLTPNPFNPCIDIQCAVRMGSMVDVRIYNLRGQQVRALYSDHAMYPNMVLTWDGRDDNGRMMPAAQYLVSATIDGTTHSEKVTMVK